MTAWELNGSYQNKTTFKKFRKSHEEELLQCFDNLERFRIHLSQTEPEPDPNFVTGIVRQEPGDLVAADERGCEKKGKRACRLYAFPCKETRILYVLRIGDKDTQSQDIQDALRSIKNIKTTTTDKKQRRP
jgi:hypothetical protein